MELTILGSGTAIPSPERGSPGYLLRAGGRRILLDCGPGSLRTAAAFGVLPATVDAVVLSHLHPDHTLDLPALFFAARNPNALREKPLTIVGPRGTRALLRHWWKGPQGKWLEPLTFELDLREVGEGSHEVLGLAADAFSVDHTPESLAWRFAERADGPVLAWSGDTAPCDGVVRAGREADLFLLECSAPDKAPFGKHLTPTAAGRIAAAAEPKRLVLTHFYPEVLVEPILEVVGERFAGRAELAADGATYRLD